MGCDLCGKNEQLFETVVEGTKLTVCRGCSDFGDVIKKVGASEEEEYKRKIVSVSEGKKKIVEGIVDNYSMLVKKAREQKGMKQKEVAKKIAEKESLIHHIEQGKYKPNIDLARKLEKFFGIVLIERYEEKEYKSSHDISEGLTLGDVIKNKLEK